MIKEIKQKSKDILKASPSVYWVIGISFCVFSAAILSLGFVIPGIEIITVPFIIIPFLFSCITCLYSSKNGGVISIKASLKCSRLYFSQPNFGTFRVIKSYLKAILSLFIVTIIFAIVFGIVLGNNEVLFADYELFLNSIETYAETQNFVLLEELLNSDNVCAKVFRYFTMISSPLFSIFFIINISKYSLSAFLRLNMPKATSSYANLIFTGVYKNNKKAYRKAYFGLNFPIIILLIVGITGASFLFNLLDMSLEYLTIFQLIFGLVFLAPFSGVYFANMEAIYAYFEDQFKNQGKVLAEDLINKIQNDININQETLNNIKKAVDDSNKNESDNKKDSYDEES